MSLHYLLFSDVHYRYPSGHEALRGVSFRIAHGQKVALAGRNGAGKSTLLMLADGLLLPSEGSISVGGIPLTRKTLPIIRRSVGFLFQHSDDQLFMPTVGEDVAFGPANMGLDATEIERRVRESLAAVGASALRDRGPFQLSGGEKKRCAIATVLAMEPSVLVMDEPTASLDPEARRLVIELLRGFDHTLLIATHDMALIAELCPRVILLDKGRIEADGPTSQLFNDPLLLARCGLEPPALPKHP